MTEPVTDALPVQAPPLPPLPYAARPVEHLLAEGNRVAAEYTGQDRLDPHRPPLAALIAGALAAAEQRGELRLRTRVAALVEQRTALRDERLAVARRFLDEGNLQPAAAELSWASTLDEQLGALRLLLAPEATP